MMKCCVTCLALLAFVHHHPAQFVHWLGPQLLLSLTCCRLFCCTLTTASELDLQLQDTDQFRGLHAPRFILVQQLVVVLLAGTAECHIIPSAPKVPLSYCQHSRRTTGCCSVSQCVAVCLCADGGLTGCCSLKRSVAYGTQTAY
jgi:hypothetical protein